VKANGIGLPEKRIIEVQPTVIPVPGGEEWEPDWLEPPHQNQNVSLRWFLPEMEEASEEALPGGEQANPLTRGAYHALWGSRTRLRAHGADRGCALRAGT
jgi:hypothetical protein